MNISISGISFYLIYFYYIALASMATATRLLSEKTRVSFVATFSAVTSTLPSSMTQKVSPSTSNNSPKTIWAETAATGLLWSLPSGPH
jgi:hypothetical protein